MNSMKQQSLAEMDTVVPLSRLEASIKPFCPKKGNGRPPMPLGKMLRIHFRRQWCDYLGLAMEEALNDVPLPHQCAGLDAFEDVMSDESTILRFRHLLERYDLAVVIVVEVVVLPSEKSFLMKRRTVLDARSGLIHSEECAMAKVAEITMLEAMAR